MSKTSIENPFAILVRQAAIINERAKDPFTHVTDNQPFFVAQRLDEGKAQIIGHVHWFIGACSHASIHAANNKAEHEICIRAQTRFEAIIALYNEEGNRIFHS